MTFETIAEITRITARISLYLFMLAFLLDTQRIGSSIKRSVWIGFAVSHTIQLSFVVAYFFSMGEPPALDPVLALLLIGVIALARLSVFVVAGWSKSPVLVAPILEVWYLWFLFTGTHITRLLNPERSGVINIYLLGLALAAGALRLYLNPKRRPV